MAAKLYNFYQEQPKAMQAALKSYWRSIATSGHKDAENYAMVISMIHHKESV